MDYPTAGCSRRSVLGVLMVMGLVVVCLIGSALVTDSLCQQGFARRLPIYPGAEVKWERHNFLSAFGMGETVLVLTTPDNAETVREWYTTATATAIRGSVDDVPMRLTRGEWTVDAEDDGSGTQIILHGVCVN